MTPPFPLQRLTIRDDAGNGALHGIALPAGVGSWPLADFDRWVRGEAADGVGVAARPLDPLGFERFQWLWLRPRHALNAPVGLWHGELPIPPGGVIPLGGGGETWLSAGRLPASPPGLPRPDWLTSRHRALFQRFTPLLVPVMTRLLGLEEHPLPGVERGMGLERLVEGGGEGLTPEARVVLLWRAARAIHAAPYENLSRFAEGIPFRSGGHLWRTMGTGWGGVCSEKCAALNFFCDLMGWPVVHWVGGRRPPPADLGQRLGDWLAGRGPAPPWQAHHILEVAVGGHRILVDVTGGNVPLLFLEVEAARPLLARGLRARSVWRGETLWLAPVEREVGEALLILSEFHARAVGLDLVVGQRLGVAVERERWVGAWLDWGGEWSAAWQTHYAALARRAGWPPPRFLTGAEVARRPPGEGGDPVLDRLPMVRRGLLAEHGDPWYTGDVTFVIQPLGGHFWRRPRVSPGLLPLLGAEVEREMPPWILPPPAGERE